MTLELVAPEPNDYNLWEDLFKEYGDDFTKVPPEEMTRVITGCIEVGIDPMAALVMAKREHEKRLDDEVPQASVRGAIQALEALGDKPRAPALTSLNRRLLASLEATTEVITDLSEMSQMAHDYVTADPYRTQDPGEVEDLLDERRYHMERIVAGRDPLVTKLRKLLDTL